MIEQILFKVSLPFLYKGETKDIKRLSSASSRVEDDVPPHMLPQKQEEIFVRLKTPAKASKGD